MFPHPGLDPQSPAKNEKTQRYGDNINNPLALCASVLESQWGWGA